MGLLTRNRRDAVYYGDFCPHSVLFVQNVMALDVSLNAHVDLRRPGGPVNYTNYSK